MSSSPREEGLQGEEMAAQYLEKAGYRLLARNVVTRWGELDIVAEKECVVVFVEVKSRSGRLFGRAEEAVTRHKQQRLTLAAMEYLAKRPGPTPSARFDVITVDTRRPRARIRHIEDAFEAQPVERP